MNELIDKIIQDNLTMISKERFNSILSYSNAIAKLSGDIVECGVWRGGMSIFLTKLFPDKTIWVCDSYEGCQDAALGKYQFDRERHTLGMYAISLEEVKDNFKKYDALTSNVSFLKGWVRDTLRPETCPIKEIALLRVDVDSYSATLETLEYLYDKVVPGGMIVFDDASLQEGHAAMQIWFKDKQTPKLYDPSNNQLLDLYSSGLPCGTYMIK